MHISFEDSWVLFSGVLCAISMNQPGYQATNHNRMQLKLVTGVKCNAL